MPKIAITGVHHKESDTDLMKSNTVFTPVANHRMRSNADLPFFVGPAANEVGRAKAEKLSSSPRSNKYRILRSQGSPNKYQSNTQATEPSIKIRSDRIKDKL